MVSHHNRFQFCVKYFIVNTYILNDHLSFILGSALIETKEQKFKRKIAANPFIPLGTALTTGVLMVSVFPRHRFYQKANHFSRTVWKLRKFTVKIFDKKFRETVF